MFKRVLIANRGEIAVRIIRCCREMDIQTVAVYSTADKDALHARIATHSVCIGKPKSAESYLNMQNIISAAKMYECDAIHPGFGFLSENSEFARLCAEHGIVFIGPSPQSMELMGNKAAAREQMKKGGVPVVPGSDGAVATAGKAAELAEQIGFPVLVKASAGGGGRGIRAAHNKEEVITAFDEARAEAKACFGDDDVYIEKLVENPKHIEFQILSDSHGNAIHLGERDCSLQRKNQKMIEESPSKAVTPKLREEMGAAAVRAAKAANYLGAGTIEYLLDSQGNFYFIEMNTRIQVEHPVTEMITGIDLIREQIRIAAGQPLRYKQEEVTFTGHAIECRINAEDPAKNFAPCPGTVEFVHLPGGMGVRVDSALYCGYSIPPYYDSMVAKIIVHAPTRLEAIHKMRRALEEFVLEGFETTSDLCHMILYNHEFIKGGYDTSFIAKNLDEIIAAECDR